jgi:dipeptidase D
MEWREWKEKHPFLQYFEDFSRIPHCSFHEEAVSDWLADKAKGWGYEVMQDQKKNLYIRKPASPGYESRPAIILQGHMDMVCEKNEATCHDFLTQGIEMDVKDDWLYAKETTLGGDNGIAVAYMLAILADRDLKHPMIECMITTEEETGMGGASVVQGDWFTGKALINLDSEEEGYALVSCAGGLRSQLVLPTQTQTHTEGWQAYRLDIKGLKGGHSGAEIHHGRGNANQILGRVLGLVSDKFSISAAAVSGGSKMNAIPREARAIIQFDPEIKDQISSFLDYVEALINQEMDGKDQLVLALTEAKDVKEAWTADTLNRVIAGLTLCPNGVQTMSVKIPGLVESSTNLGVVETKDGKVFINNAIRSSVGSLKHEIAGRIESLAQVLGGDHIKGNDYPAWEYREDSPVREKLIKTYKEMTGQDLKVTAIHAGLECGILARAIPDLDMISIGPDMKDVHTPDETMNLASAVRTYEFLIQVLAHYND